MNGDDGVVFAQLPAAVDDFLRAAFDFWVATLYRVEVQLGRVFTCGHRRSCTATQTNQQAWAAQLNEQSAFRDDVFVGLLVLNVAQATCNHDGLVVAAHGAVEQFFKRAEITQQIGATEFIVKRCATNRALNHDV